MRSIFGFITSLRNIGILNRCFWTPKTKWGKKTNCNLNGLVDRFFDYRSSRVWTVHFVPMLFCRRDYKSCLLWYDWLSDVMFRLRDRYRRRWSRKTTGRGRFDMLTHRTETFVVVLRHGFSIMAEFDDWANCLRASSFTSKSVRLSPALSAGSLSSSSFEKKS